MNNTFLLFYSPKPRSQVWILIYISELVYCNLRFLAFTLNGDVFNIHTPSLFFPKITRETESAIFSTKKIWKVTIFWLGMENGFWFEKTRLHLIANLPALCCVISVSDSSVHFVAEFLHYSVKSGLTLALGHPIERPTAEDWAYTSRGALYDCVSWFKTIFFSTALII